MEVAYRTRRLQRAAEDSAYGARLWGDDVAIRFRERIAMIRAASSMASLRAIQSLRTHPLHGPYAGLWSIRLAGRWRLIVRPSDDRVTVEEVTNHYGD